MIKKEITEIKKTIKAEDGCTVRVAGCYVSAEREQKMTFTERFGNLPDEEVYKYVEILQKGLSGSKNLADVHVFKCNDALYKAWETEGKELSDLYKEIIDNYTPSGNYLILVSYGVYDVPAKGTDGRDQGESEDVYRYLTVSICPVELSKAGLCCEAKEVKAAKRDWMIKPPVEAFLYPAFTERYEDHENVLYYAKKDVSTNLTENLFGVSKVTTAAEQKEMFTDTISEALGEHCTIGVVKDINAYIVDSEEEYFGPEDIKTIAIASGASREDAETLAEKIQENMPEEKLKKDAIAEKSLTIVTKDATIKANKDSGVFRKNVDGYECIVIPLRGEVTVNGTKICAEGKD